MLTIDDVIERFDGSLAYSTNSKEICQYIADLLKELKERGLTILLITHDAEFAAECADRCALFFDGAIAACENTADFMNGNRYYTTAASRITRGIIEGCYTVDRAAKAMGGDCE